MDKEPTLDPMHVSSEDLSFVDECENLSREENLNVTETEAKIARLRTIIEGCNIVGNDKLSDRISALTIDLGRKIGQR